MRCPRIAYNAFQTDFTFVVYATQCVTMKNGCLSCRLSDSGKDAKVKGLDYLGAWNRLMANSLEYFRTELDFSVTGVAKTRVRLRVGVEGEG